MCASQGGVKKREHEDTLDAPTSKRPKTGPIKKEKEQYPSGVKRLLLEQDPELKQVYDQVVTTGIITDEEFWSTRQEMIREAEKRGRKDLQQKQGLPSQLQSMIQPISKEGETVRYRLTNAMIHQIFVEYPLVERAYKEFVPHKVRTLPKHNIQCTRRLNLFFFFFLTLADDRKRILDEVLEIAETKPARKGTCGEGGQCYLPG